MEAHNTGVSLPHMSALSVISELLSLGPSLSSAMTASKKSKLLNSSPVYLPSHWVFNASIIPVFARAFQA